jgi:hypothetical protein
LGRRYDSDFTDEYEPGRRLQATLAINVYRAPYSSFAEEPPEERRATKEDFRLHGEQLHQIGVANWGCTLAMSGRLENPNKLSTLPFE